MGRSYTAPLRLSPRPSRWLRRLVLMQLLLVAVSLSYLSQPLLQLGLLLLLALGGWRYWQQRPELAGAPVELVWGADGLWEWTSRSAGGERLELADDCVVTPLWLVVSLRSRDGRRRFRYLFLPDSLDGDTLRHLRARLTMQRDCKTATTAQRSG